MMRGAKYLFVICLAAAPQLAPCQETTSENTDKNLEIDTLSPVVVTATRREETLQSIPIAVSVLDGRDLEQANLNNIQDIVRQAPSADFRTGTSTKNVSMFIRGVGTITTSGGIEPTVATVVDGVVLAHPGQTSMELLDLERVEVVRGPQGTLFGMNASGGVFNVLTRDPSQEQYRYIDAAYYQGNERRLRVGIATEISDGAAWGSLTGIYGAYQGNVTNVFDGRQLNGYDRVGLRGKLVLKPESNLKLTFGADYFDDKHSNTPVYIAPPNTTLVPIAPVIASPGNRQANLNFGMFNHNRHRGISAQVDWEAKGHTLTSITAYRDWENRQQQDIDLSPETLVSDAGSVSLRQFSQEMRLTSPRKDLLEYVLGVFYHATDVDESYHRTLRNIADGTGQAEFGVRRTNIATFGEGRIKLTPSSHLIAGLRWTHNTVDYHFRRTTTLPVDLGVMMHSPFTSKGKTRAHGTSGRLGLQFDLAPGLMAYTTYSRGYKGPAYNVYANMWAADTRVVAPETSNSYEIGFKSEAFGKRLRFNLALFSARYDNYQTALPGVIDGMTVMQLVNAGKVGTSGLELDFAFKPATRWEITGALANIHAQVRQFNCASNQVDCVASGTQMPFSPKWRLSLGSSYALPLKDGKSIILSGNYRWQSRIQFQLPQNPDAVQGAYGILDASITLDDSLHNWRLALLGKNLGNRSYAANQLSQFDGIARFVPRDDQRYFGLQFRQDF